MARILALDTSTEACSVALIDGEHIEERFVVAPREHMLRLLPMVDALLAAHQLTLAQLDAIAFGRGPGSFTGLRICLSVVQGLAFGAGLPVVPVSTLATLAQGAGAPPDSLILAAIDARMDEVYWGWFHAGADGLVQAVGGEAVSPPEQVVMAAGAAAPRSVVGVGTGFGYGERLAPGAFQQVDAAALPRARDLLALALPAWQRGEAVAAEEAVPVYLRDQVAWGKPG